jgi:predicted amidohydrolase YtcJ
MLNTIKCSPIVAVSFLIASCHVDSPEEPADMILINGGIYTVDADRSWAEAVAIRAGEIIAVGDNDSILNYSGDSTETIDLAGGMALPGLHDAHTHPLEGGRLMRQCDLTNAGYSVEAVFEYIRQCVADSEDEWIIGFGLDLALFGQDGPDYSALNNIDASRYFYIIAVDGHSALVNDLVLDLAGFDSDTPDPVNGIIERRAGSNEPNGTVREAANDMISSLRPDVSFGEERDAMLDAVNALNAVGVTSVVDAWAGELEMQLWKSLDDSDELSLRVVNSIIDEGVFAKHVGEDFERVLKIRKNYSSDLINNESIKMMIDGVLEGETAALVEPYIELGHSGILNYAKEDLNSRVARYDAMGLQIHMHTIGDGAARAGLDAIEFARKQNEGNTASEDLRHHLSHLELIHEDDLPRFAELDTSANFTAAWAHPNPWTTELNLPVVGQERVDRFYPIKSVQSAGGNIVGGSDWIYGPLDPLESIEIAITRQNADNADAPVGNISDGVDLSTAIDMYTVNAAWLMHQEDKVGSIEVGKRADIVVFDKNLFEIPATEINEAKVRVTIFDGKVVYRSQ